jgi:hypothetical protein
MGHTIVGTAFGVAIACAIAHCVSGPLRLAALGHGTLAVHPSGHADGLCDARGGR